MRPPPFSTCQQGRGTDYLFYEGSLQHAQFVAAQELPRPTKPSDCTLDDLGSLVVYNGNETVDCD